MDLKPKPLPGSRVKSAWQNEAGMYAVKTMFSDEEPMMLSEEELDKLIELMTGYRWIIFENPQITIRK